MLSTGKIAMDGTKIYLGYNMTGVETQPVFKGQDLHDALSDFATAVDTTIKGLMGNLSAPLLAADTLTGPLATFITEIENALSEDVFVK
jgi:hypothetical protein